jgi:4-amino-4-deoxy-L-arabinose transferase-like glycosyltransferase
MTEPTPPEQARPAVTAEGKRESDPSDTSEDGGPPLIPKGNKLRLVRGGVTAGVGLFLGFLLMAENGQLSFGVPLGIALMAVAAWGIMDLLGTFDDEGEATTETTLAALGRPLGAVLAGLVLFGGALAAAGAGLLTPAIWTVVVTATFLVLVMFVFDLGVKLGPWSKDELGNPRPLWQRHGFWLIVASTVLLLPCLGAYSLWDPWETHYGEVAREILARDDWISTWWAQDGFFYSKPELDLWIQAIFMATLGVHYLPGQMLKGAGGAVAHPEWIVRTPIFLLTIIAIYILYKGVARVFGRRAGLLGGLVLATMPDWYFLAHQSMTDMPFVGPTATAMGLILIGLYTPEDEKARLYDVKVGKATWRLSAWHLVFGAILISALPQILYLFSRNLELVVHGAGPYGFRPHWDEFRTGSGGGNCGLPGNEGCHLVTPAGVPQNLRGELNGIGPMALRLFSGYEPILQALTWTAVVGFLLYLNWGERRLRRLAYLGGWYFAALGTAAKGPAGFGLPILCGLAYVATTRRWSELVRFELVSGLCIVAAVAIPWWVAMYVRHGSQFSDELIFHDLVNRAFSHVHDTNEGDDTSFRFYIWQLGYALFPWTGLAPLGLIYGLRRSETAGRGRAEASILLMMWFVFAFALFSFMGTKFHHYIFPAVPPVGMLIGIALDDMLGEGPVFKPDLGDKPVRFLMYGGVFALAAILGVIGVAKSVPGSIWGDKVTGDAAAPSHVLSAVLCGLSVLLLVFGVRAISARLANREDHVAKVVPRLYRDAATDEVVADPESTLSAGHAGLMFSAAALAGALVVGVVSRDLVIKPDNSSQPGAARLLQLFTYRYDRAWPESLDFSAILTGFGAVAVVLGLALTIRRLRTPLIFAFLAFAMAWSVWGMDFYMVKVAPHWGQREILASYYADRAGPNEPIVAYQMNWKGENFYSSNEIPAFVSSGGTFTSWIKTQREKGTKVIYFVTEHGRISGLKGEVQGKSYKEITDKTVNNKFVLVRAEI